MQKPIDSLAQFQSLRLALSSERTRLQKRLAQIDSALAGALVPTVASPVQPKSKSPVSPAKRPDRPQNATNLRDAITKAVAENPLSVREIVEAVQKNGYQFTSKNPVNSLGAFLYGAQGKKHFKRVDGKFRKK